MKAITGLIVVVVAFVGVALLGGSGKGIHPIGSQALYLSGESCTVNTRKDTEGMKADLEECLRLHRLRAMEAKFGRATSPTWPTSTGVRDEEVYQAGSCFIGMADDRPVAAIEGDIEECLRLHQSASSN